MRFKKTIKDNILTIENLHEDNLYVKVFVDKYCCNQCNDCQDCQYELASQAILKNSEKHVLSLGDGSYNVILSDSKDNIIDSFDIKVYTELRAEIVDLFFKKFCEDSECSPCGGRGSSKGDCRELAYKALLKDPIVIESMLTYAMLKGYFNNPVFMGYFQETLDFYRCSIIADNCNQKKYLKFFGKYNDDYNLFGKFASILMLGFYLMEKLEGNESGLEAIYRLCELKKCINKYGITYSTPLIHNFSLNIGEVYGEQIVEITRVSFVIENIHSVRPNSLSIIYLNDNTTIAKNLSINSYLDIPYKVTIKPGITYSWKATVEGIDGKIYESNIYTIVGKPKPDIINTMYYGNTNIDPRVFQSMDINNIFNIPNMMSKDIIGDSNTTFTINQTSTLHYLIIPEEKMTLVKAGYGGVLGTTLWNGNPEESAYFTTNKGGVFNGIKYRVFFSYSRMGAFSEDIRITVKNKV